jgi:putative ABC transport system permease protein
VRRESAAFKMLFHDRAAALGSIAGVVAIVFLVGQQLAIFFGLMSYMSGLADRSGADVWILARNADNVNSTASLPMAYRDRAAGIRGVRQVSPLVLAGGSLKRQDGNTQAVQVVGLERPDMAGGPNRFYSGSVQDLLDGEGVSVDRLDLPLLGNPTIGSVLTINEKRVRVAAFTQGQQGFAGTLVYTNLEKARDISNLPADRCTDLLVRVEPGIPVQSMIPLLKRALPRTEVFSTADLSRVTRVYYLKNTGIGTSFFFSTAVGALVGLVIIALTMYTNVLNKSRDYAMLRALGARRRDILWIVFLQSLYIAAIGILAGFTMLAGFLSGTRDTALPAFLPWTVPVIHAATTLILCLMGSLIAMRRAVKIEPASAFR